MNGVDEEPGAEMTRKLTLLELEKTALKIGYQQYRIMIGERTERCAYCYKDGDHCFVWRVLVIPSFKIGYF